MVVVRRNNYSLMCIEVGRVESWTTLTTFLEEKKSEYEAKGYLTCWDDNRLKTGLVVWNEGESYFFCVYSKRLPRTKREFVW